jgi:hypothetical protein
MSTPRPLTPTSSYYLKIKDQHGAEYFLPIADETKTVAYAKELIRKLTRMYVQKLEVKDGEAWRELDDQKTLVEEGVGENSDVLAELFSTG